MSQLQNAPAFSRANRPKGRAGNAPLVPQAPQQRRRLGALAGITDVGAEHQLVGKLVEKMDGVLLVPARALYPLPADSSAQRLGYSRISV